MQILQVAKKIPTSKNQKTETQVEEYENKREGHGQNIALTKNIIRIYDSDTFYVESENSTDLYYFVRYNFSGKNSYCSCPDNSIRGQFCKHLFACEYSIRFATLQEKEHLPTNIQRYPQNITAKDWRNDSYDF